MLNDSTNKRCLSTTLRNLLGLRDGRIPKDVISNVESGVQKGLRRAGLDEGIICSLVNSSSSEIRVIVEQLEQSKRYLPELNQNVLWLFDEALPKVKTEEWNEFLSVSRRLIETTKRESFGYIFQDPIHDLVMLTDAVRDHFRNKPNPRVCIGLTEWLPEFSKRLFPEASSHYLHPTRSVDVSTWKVSDIIVNDNDENLEKIKQSIQNIPDGGDLDVSVWDTVAFRGRTSGKVLDLLDIPCADFIITRSTEMARGYLRDSHWSNVIGLSMPYRSSVKGIWHIDDWFQPVTAGKGQIEPEEFLEITKPYLDCKEPLGKVLQEYSISPLQLNPNLMFSVGPRGYLSRSYDGRKFVKHCDILKEMLKEGRELLRDYSVNSFAYILDDVVNGRVDSLENITGTCKKSWKVLE